MRTPREGGHLQAGDRDLQEAHHAAPGSLTSSSQRRTIGSAVGATRAVELRHGSPSSSVLRGLHTLPIRPSHVLFLVLRALPTILAEHLRASRRGLLGKSPEQLHRPHGALHHCLTGLGGVPLPPLC